MKIIILFSLISSAVCASEGQNQLVERVRLFREQGYALNSGSEQLKESLQLVPENACVSDQFQAHQVKINDNEYLEVNRQGEVLRKSLVNGQCRGTKIADLPQSLFSNGQSWYHFKLMFADTKPNPRLLITSPTGPFNSSSKVSILTLSPTGTLIETKEIQGFKAMLEPGNLTPFLSTKNDHILVSLKDMSDPSERYHLYEVNLQTGSKRLIAKNTIIGSYTENGILAMEGDHTHDLIATHYSGDSYQNRSVITTPYGYKNNFKIEENKLKMLNHQLGQGYQEVSIDLSQLTVNTRTPASSETRLQQFTSQNITYPSADGRQVPGILHLPEGQCEEGKKVPLILYQHGGSFTSGAFGNNFNSESSHTFLTQSGYAVLSGSRYGDEYLGGEFERRDAKVFAEVGYKKMLEDIQAAGEYAKNHPCIDPNKIIYMGHSMGANLGAIYYTSQEFKEKSPFAGFVLEAGFYNANRRLPFSMRDQVATSFYANNANHELSRLTYSWTSFCFVQRQFPGPVYQPESEITDFNQAIDLLAQLNSEGDQYFGVVMSLPEEKYERANSVNHAEYHHGAPLLLISGKDDPAYTEDDNAKAFEKALRKHNATVEHLRVDSSHGLTETDQETALQRIVELVESLEREEN